MARKTRKQRKILDSYYIVCEGEVTEPNLLKDFREYLVQNGMLENKQQIDIYPIPRIEENIPTTRGAHSRKGKALQGDEEPQDKGPTGPQPLSWVEYALLKLEEHKYTSSWAVFDKDRHPKAKEAFELAEKSQEEGKKLFIAFTSVCFEHYLLLNFEYCTKAFQRSECKNNGKVIGCGREEGIEGDCLGDTCVNGYARHHKYWLESKKEDFGFHLIDDKIWFGVYNAMCLREEKDREDKQPIWKKNPYTTFDYLLTSFMGYRELSPNESLTVNHIRFSIDQNKLVIENLGSKMEIILGANFTYLYQEDKSAKCAMQNFMISPDEIKEIELSCFSAHSVVSLQFGVHKLYFKS